VNLLVAIVVAVLFASGANLMVRRDVVKLAAGTLLMSNAALLLLVSFGAGATESPLLPVEDPENVADPLAQALALTAVVIGVGTTVLLLRVSMAVERSHDTIEMADLVEAEESEDEEDRS
jgi:multicomponent Na+:H+ antiporter subunit C